MKLEKGSEIVPNFRVKTEFHSFERSTEIFAQSVELNHRKNHPNFRLKIYMNYAEQPEKLFRNSDLSCCTNFGNEIEKKFCGFQQLGMANYRTGLDNSQHF